MTVAHRRVENGEGMVEEENMEVDSGGKSGSRHSFFILRKRAASSATLE